MICRFDIYQWLVVIVNDQLNQRLVISLNEPRIKIYFQMKLIINLNNKYLHY